MEKVSKFLNEGSVQLLVLVVTILGTVVPLHIHLDSKTQMNLAAIQNEMREFKFEMKQLREEAYQERVEFHGRLILMEERARHDNR